MPAFTFVDQPNRISANFDKQTLLGVDTEFMRERTFFSQLCLVQLATDNEIYCVDPLTDHEMIDFWQAINRCTWVLHSARQDIEVIYQTAQFMPASIFDTQIAAGLLGFAPQMGYAGLISELFDVELAKSHTRANWTVHVAQFNNLDSVQNLFERNTAKIAAIIVEPIAGNMGVVPPQTGFLEGLREISGASGALLVFDEVMTGRSSVS